MSALNIAALILFGVCWIFYQPLLTLLSRRGGSAINTDMTVIRAAWMRNMARRENRFMDGQLLAQTLNSASFFASSNLLLIAAAAGALVNGDVTFKHISSLEVVRTSSRMLFEGQLGLVLLALSRGLLDFIWSIRQMNYTIAAIGAVPDGLDDASHHTFGDLAARLLNPAVSSFNAGIRGYYFALAAAAWLFGPIAFMATTLGAVALLLWRQRRSGTAHAISDLRKLLETHHEAAGPGKGRDPSSPA
jgi:uncharacterized membrane protein